MDQAANTLSPATLEVSSRGKTDGRVLLGVYAALAGVLAIFAALVYVLGFPFLIVAVDAAAILALAVLVYITADVFSAAPKN